MEKIRTHVNKRTKEVTYQATVRVKGFDPHYKTCETMAAALEWQKATHARILKEKRLADDPRSWLPKSGLLADQRLRDVLTHYQATFPKRDWHVPTINATLNLCGDPTIGQLYPSWIKNYFCRARRTLTNRGTPNAWASIEKQLSVISTAIKWRACQLDICPPRFVVNDDSYSEALKAEGLTKEDMNNERDRRFEPGEEERLMGYLLSSKKRTAELWMLFVQFAIHTGARLQEMIFAEWNEIDASGEWWNIPGKHSKTKSRSMVLIDEAMDILERLKELRDPSSNRLFPKLGTRKSLSNRWARDAKRIGLENFVFHDLRHEGLSRLAITQINIPIKLLMPMVGHSSLKMFERYAKLRPNELSRLVIRRPRPAPLIPSHTTPGQPILSKEAIPWTELREQRELKGAKPIAALTQSQSRAATMSC